MPRRAALAQPSALLFLGLQFLQARQLTRSVLAAQIIALLRTRILLLHLRKLALPIEGAGSVLIAQLREDRHPVRCVQLFVIVQKNCVRCHRVLVRLMPAAARLFV